MPDTIGVSEDMHVYFCLPPSGPLQSFRVAALHGELIRVAYNHEIHSSRKALPMNVEAKLLALGISLPAAPLGVGAYVPWVRTGNLIFISGQLPWHEGKLTHTGKLGGELTIEQGALAARACIINALAQLKTAVGDLDNVKQIVRLEGFVHSAPGFHEHPKVLNGASELLNEVFGPRGRHARIALGINEMPLNAAVQIALIAEVL